MVNAMSTDLLQQTLGNYSKASKKNKKIEKKKRK